MCPRSAAYRISHHRQFAPLDKWLLLAIVALLACMGIPKFAQSAQLGVEWDPVADERVAFYQVKWGTESGQYQGSEETTSTIATIPDLEEGQTYYIAARACSEGATLCSEFSEEISATVAYARPQANFSLNAVSGYAPHVVEFADASTGTVSDYQWDFDDGSNSTERSPVHVYTEPGTYLPKLTVIGPGGTGSVTYPEPIVVTGESALFPQGEGPFVEGPEPTEEGPSPTGAQNPSLPIEVGEVALSQERRRVNFKDAFLDPVVIVSPLSGNGSDPAVVRIDSVDSDGFWAQVQEWEYLDGPHTIEKVGYVVVERGRHELPNGTWIEADSLETSGNGDYVESGFNAPFVSIPVMLSSVTSANDATAVTTRLRNIDQTGFEIALQHQEANAVPHGLETVDYVAWEPSSGEVNGLRFEVGQTFDEVTNKPERIFFAADFIAAPVLLADMQTADGGDTATLRWRNKGPLSADIWVAEEKSKDAETTHTTESVGFVAIAAATPAPLAIEVGDIDVDGSWRHIDLQQRFSNPVVVAKVVTAYDAAPAVVRIKQVDSTGFSIRLQEWDYLREPHAIETVSYMVVERGTHQLPNGTWLEAGQFDGDGKQAFTRASFAAPFDKVPVVATSVSTYSGLEAVTTRVRKISTNGFEARLQEAEASRHVHAVETISYIALEPSLVELDGLRFEIGRTEDSITDNVRSVSYASQSVSPPIFLADMQSTDGGDTAGLRVHRPDGVAADIWVQEEQSKDQEIRHTTETVGYIVINEEADLLP